VEAGFKALAGGVEGGEGDEPGPDGES